MTGDEIVAALELALDYMHQHMVTVCHECQHKRCADKRDDLGSLRRALDQARKKAESER